MRPIGQQDPQPLVPQSPPQFYFLWAPLNFDDSAFFYAENAFSDGSPWAKSARYITLDKSISWETAIASGQLAFKSGTRHAKSATISCNFNDGGSLQAELEPQYNFYQSGLGYLNFEWGHGYSVFSCVLRPRSTGTVTLANDGSRCKVRIDFNFLADQQDQNVLVEAVKKAREILASPKFDHLRGEEMAPGNAVQTDTQILDYLRQTATTVYHPVGTCKMGIDDMAVVDPATLKVKGMANLRVMDASVMPRITSGNTSAPTMMIAAKGADMMLSGG